jgi:hypothetical protein
MCLVEQHRQEKVPTENYFEEPKGMQKVKGKSLQSINVETKQIGRNPSLST